jgi:histidyl-tRNA synthetase
MSLGLERIVEVVQEHGLLPSDRSVAEVAVALFPTTIAEGARLANELRAAGFNVDLSLQPNRSVGDQLKLAGRKGIPVAVIVGESEAAAGTVSYKDLRSGTQQTVARPELPSALRKLLSR